jgi:IS5 family transposase
MVVPRLSRINSYFLAMGLGLILKDSATRPMSETVFTLLKGDESEKLRSRTWHGQFRELMRKCIVHNLSRAVG